MGLSDMNMSRDFLWNTSDKYRSDGAFDSVSLARAGLQVMVSKCFVKGVQLIFEKQSC